MIPRGRSYGMPNTNTSNGNRGKGPDHDDQEMKEYHPAPSLYLDFNKNNNNHNTYEDAAQTGQPDHPSVTTATTTINGYHNPNFDPPTPRSSSSGPNPDTERLTAPSVRPSTSASSSVDYSPPTLSTSTDRLVPRPILKKRRGDVHCSFEEPPADPDDDDEGGQGAGGVSDHTFPSPALADYGKRNRSRTISPNDDAYSVRPTPSPDIYHVTDEPPAKSRDAVGNAGRRATVPVKLGTTTDPAGTEWWDRVKRGARLGRARPSVFSAQVQYFHYACSGLYELLILDFSLFVVISAIIRINAISLVYLICLLVAPLLPTPTSKSMAGHTGLFLKFVIIFSALACIGQICFHVVLLAMPPYGHIFLNCTFKESLTRDLGFQRLDKASPIQITRLVVPDLLVLLVSCTVYLLCHKLRPFEDTDKFLHRLSNVPPTKIHSRQSRGKSQAALAGSSKERVRLATQPAISTGDMGLHLSGIREDNNPRGQNLTVGGLDDGGGGGLSPTQHNVDSTSNPEDPSRRRSSILDLVGSGLNMLAGGSPPKIPAASPDKKKPLVSVLSEMALFFALAASGIIYPSLPSALYFIIFISGATAWACCRRFIFRTYDIDGTVTATGRGNGVTTPSATASSVALPTLAHKTSGKFKFLLGLRFALLAYVATHIIALYLYQFNYFQAKYPPDELLARLLGLTAIVKTNCDIPYQVDLHPVTWECYLNPAFLLCLYWLICINIKISFALSLLKDKSSPTLSPINRDPMHKRSPGESSKLLDESAYYNHQSRMPSTSTPINASKSLSSNKQSNLHQTTSAAAQTSSRAPSIMIAGTGPYKAPPAYKHWATKFSPLYHLLSALVNVIYRQTYIISLVLMMVWAITYHSWLTFVFLLWACIVWMSPDSRRSCLYSSPFFVSYAIILLLLQFIYGLKLTDQELPSGNYRNFPLGQFGLIKYHYPCLPLSLKMIFTCLFWITMRQFVMEKKAHYVAKSISQDIGTASTRESLSRATKSTDIVSQDGARITSQFGHLIYQFCVKYWILICCGFLLFMGIASSHVVLYRIGYTMFFVVFLIMFQIAYKLWRLTMYVFWLFLIGYSMVILILIYTYQFENFPEYWHNGTHMSYELLKDFGLEQYDTRTLFVRLFTPTAFIIIIILQVHYFHKPFLNVTDMDKITIPKNHTQDDLARIKAIERQEKSNGKDIIYYITWVCRRANYMTSIVSGYAWRFFEIHGFKLVALALMLLCVYDPRAINLPFVLVIVIGLAVNPLQTLMSYIAAIWTGCLIIAKMGYQLDYFKVEYFQTNCTNKASINSTVDNAEWLGFIKVPDIAPYIKGYLGILFLLCLQKIVKLHLRMMRARYQINPLRHGVTFPGVVRKHADKNVFLLLKYLINFGFYRFGVELTLMSIIATIGLRWDAWSVIYSVWLGILLFLSRKGQSIIWPVYVMFLVIAIPLQYLARIGMPMGLCVEYPWTYTLIPGLRDWLYLPDFIAPPSSHKLTTDFFQLLFATCQLVVFRVEFDNAGESYEGGSNKEIWKLENHYTLDNPVADFVTHTNTFLDKLKFAFFSYSFWVTLTIMLITATNRVSLFCMGYLIASFFFLWYGNELFLKPLKTIYKFWTVLIAYNFFVIFIKTLLQVLGCAYMSVLEANLCWLVQLLSIACLKAGFGASTELNVSDECSVPVEQAGILWDGICFSFLILQRRIFGSFYFKHIIAEIYAQQLLASRGAELVNQIKWKEVNEQDAREREVMEKIKKKMEQIKNQNQKIARRATREPGTHFQAIRAGDYYMFEDLTDDDTEPLADLEYKDTSLLEGDEAQGIGPIQLLNVALTKGGIKGAVKEGKKEAYEGRDGVPPFGPDHDGLRRRKTVPRDNRIKSIYPQSTTSPLAITDKPGPSQEYGQKEDARSDDSDEDEDNYKEALPPLSTVGWICQKIRYLLHFLTLFIYGLLESATQQLNKISRDYRYIAQILASEKGQRKEEEKRKMEQIMINKSVEIVMDSPTQVQNNKNNHAEEHEFATPYKTFENFTLDDEGQGKVDRSIITKFITALYYVLISRSELVCYFLVVLNMLQTASILAMPPPFMVFLWGTLSIPRPSKTFWVTLITYVEAIVIIKYLFQFGFFPWVGRETKDPFWAPRIIGIEKREYYATYDLVLLLVLFFHRSILKSLGLWKDNTRSISKDTVRGSDPAPVTSNKIKEDIYHDTNPDFEVAESHREDQLLSNNEDPALMDPNNDVLVLSPDDSSTDMKIKKRRKLMTCDFSHYFKTFWNFFDKLLHPQFRVTVDVYAPMFLCDFITFLIVVFGYSSFGSGVPDEGDVTSYISENKIPIPFLIMLVVQFALIIVDRALFLRKNIVGKLIFQFFLVIVIHVWMFFIIPAVTEREFYKNTPARLWYFSKCCYFILSSYQIRSGYPTRILGNFLTKKYNYTNLILYKGFALIPFLWELRTLMDWMWTDTTLTVFYWVKLEDIYASIYTLKCYRKSENDYPTPRGVRRPPLTKYLMGGAMLLVLIFIIWFPLVLFALTNTVGTKNLPYDCSVEISIAGYEPLYRMSARNQFIKPFTESQYRLLIDQHIKDKSVQVFLAGYEASDVIEINLMGNSTNLWTISPPSMSSLQTILKGNTSVQMKMRWSFTRAAETKLVEPTISDSNLFYIPPGSVMRKQLADMLVGNETPPILIKHMFPRYVRIPAKEKPSYVKPLVPGGVRSFRDVTLKLRTETTNISRLQWWEVREVPISANDKYYNPFYLTMIAFSDLVFPGPMTFLAEYGIIGLYVSLVLVIGRLVRSFVSGLYSRIMFDELPNVDRVLQLCLDIYLVRESREFHLEEELFAKLIFLYRSPETLIKWTKDKAQ